MLAETQPADAHIEKCISVMLAPWSPDSPMTICSAAATCASMAMQPEFMARSDDEDGCPKRLSETSATQKSARRMMRCPKRNFDLRWNITAYCIRTLETQVSIRLIFQRKSKFLF